MCGHTAIRKRCTHCMQAPTLACPGQTRPAVVCPSHPAETCSVAEEAQLLAQTAGTSCSGSAAKDVMEDASGLRRARLGIQAHAQVPSAKRARPVHGEPIAQAAAVKDVATLRCLTDLSGGIKCSQTNTALRRILEDLHRRIERHHPQPLQRARGRRVPCAEHSVPQHPVHDGVESHRVDPEEEVEEDGEDGIRPRGCKEAGRCLAASLSDGSEVDPHAEPPKLQKADNCDVDPQMTGQRPCA
mmetsp:Transcript_5662/g.16849  ORF Transcript_5662/g.16849 Transcript_5662/m.16849 type:complete len:243 (-) Transcript_5662:589-1317(-)